MQGPVATFTYRLFAIVMLVPATTGCAQTRPHDPDAIRGSGQGQVHFASDDIRELSGITYLGSDLFAVVSDKGGKMGVAKIKIDRESGAIIKASIDQIIRLEGGRDLEGITIDPSTCLLLTADEADQSIDFHHFPSGKHLEPVDVPEVFQKARSNLGFESISASMWDRNIWAANEEPLEVDGPRATQQAGGLVRLQRFDQALKPTEQFAYRVDPHRGSDNLIQRAQSGVTGLVALPNGGLIVMERELGGSGVPSFRVRLYLIDTTGATDTSETDAITEDNTTPVRKQLLFESNTGLANFEGITLGPQLENGEYTLVLVSDDGSNQYNPQNLMSLRIPASLVDPISPKESNASEAD
ncbi:MAG: esterase-like activity of phytase family protein [Planctomycetota bacterium]